MLPDGLSAAEYDEIYKDDARFRPAARAILARHGVEEEPRRLGGSALVYAAGGRVLKLFPPIWTSSCAGERAVLEAVAGRLGVASPEVLAAGELEGWPYLVMTELAGRPLEELWAGWDRAMRERAVRGVGELLERLHACPAPAGLEPPGGWARFLDEQAAGCLERQRGRGLGEADLAWLAGELPELLAVAQEAARGPHVLLHTEIGPGHVLFDDDGTPLGLLDFADALVGPAEYDLVAAALFVARGDANLVRIIVSTDGAPAETRTLFAFTVLHRYAHLPWYLRETGAPDLAALARRFGRES